MVACQVEQAGIEFFFRVASFFHTLLYITKSTAKLINFHKIRKFFHFYLAVSFFLLTFATAIKKIVNQSSRATVFAYGFIAAGFFYADRFPFSRWWANGIPFIHGGCMNRKI